MLALPMPVGLLLASLCVVFAAGIVRGFAGFGFSALCVAGMSLYMSPAQLCRRSSCWKCWPVCRCCAARWKDVDWSWLSWLVVGNALCIPLGVALLAYVDETPLRLLIGALLLLAATLLRSGWSSRCAHAWRAPGSPGWCRAWSTAWPRSAASPWRCC